MTISDAYKARQIRARLLGEKLMKRLSDHAKRQEVDKSNWNFVEELDAFMVRYEELVNSL